MQQPFTKTGGASVGWTNASWPLARLSSTVGKLIVKARLLGTYIFLPEQVSAIERYVKIPVIGWGIRIRHIVPEYPEKIIFWSFSNPEEILNGILDSGFITSASSAPIPTRRGIPMRWSAIIAIVIAWNALFLMDYLRSGIFPPVPGWGSCMALFMLFFFSAGTLYSPTFQKILLKPDRKVGEIQPLLRLLILISGVIFIVVSIIVASGGFNHFSHGSYLN